MQPNAASTDAVTALLREAGGGNSEALKKLLPLVYGDLQAIAHRKLRFERRGHTLNTTDLVHESYLRLVDQERVDWQSRAHFYAIAAQAMRRILVNYAVRRRAEKRGGDVVKVPFDETLDASLSVFADHRIEEVVAVDRALEQLKAFNERGHAVVEYRFFGGLTYEEIAEVMGLSTMTVRRAWTTSKLWLRREMTRGGTRTFVSGESEDEPFGP